MHFSSSIAFDFKMPSSSTFTHAHNKKGPAAESRQAKCLFVPVEANLNSKVFSPLTHHSLEKSKKTLGSRLLCTYVVVSYFDTLDWFIVHLAQT